MKLRECTKEINNLSRKPFDGNFFSRIKHIDKEINSNKNELFNEDKKESLSKKTDDIKQDSYDIKNNDSSLNEPSCLDIFDKNSLIVTSNFQGFCYLLYSVCFFFILIIPLINFMDKGYFFDTLLLNMIIKKLPLLILLWINIYLFSITAYFIFLLYLRKKISYTILIFFQILLETCILTFTIYFCIYIKFPAIERGVLISVGYICVMKIHSYIHINLEHEKKESKTYLLNSKNLTLVDYITFLTCPSLVYKFKFKRIKNFRPKYFMEKFFSMILILIFQYLIYTHYILPILKKLHYITIIEAIIRLMFPCFIIFLSAFYVIFECICNVSAELSKFGEREFYQDWWNSTIWYEFSRKWNNIVQLWLHKHIYLIAKDKYKLSKTKSRIITYLFSAIFHELIMIVCFQTCKCFLIFFMFLQFPLSWLGQHFYRNTPIGNFIFWSNIMIGVPLIFISYGGN